jgi:hypothetical protein
MRAPDGSPVTAVQASYLSPVVDVVAKGLSALANVESAFVYGVAPGDYTAATAAATSAAPPPKTYTQSLCHTHAHASLTFRRADASERTYMLSITGVEVDDGVVSFYTASGHSLTVQKNGVVGVLLANGTIAIAQATTAIATSKSESK